MRVCPSAHKHRVHNLVWYIKLIKNRAEQLVHYYLNIYFHHFEHGMQLWTNQWKCINVGHVYSVYCQHAHVLQISWTTSTCSTLQYTIHWIWNKGTNSVYMYNVIIIKIKVHVFFIHIALLYWEYTHCLNNLDTCISVQWDNEQFTCIEIIHEFHCGKNLL